MDQHEQFMADWKARVQRQGYWEPPITQKQGLLAAFPEKYILASGPRHSTKTVGALHALVSHAYNIPEAQIAFVSISQTNALDSGAWVDLTENVIPAWINGGFGMKWIEKPRATTYTHKSYCIISNRFGGQARIQLYSLADEKEAEALFKNKSFTMIFITELSKFRELKTFVTLKECLRGIGRPDHHFKFIADTNPADEGSESWIYQLWYGVKELTAPNEYQRQFRLLEFFLDDNPFYSEQKKQEIRQSYEYDPELYKRMVEGQWIRVANDSYFQKNFRSTHIVPDETHGGSEELTLQEGCSQMLSGSDFGNINHSAHLIEPFFHNGKKHYKVMTEIVSVGFEVGLEDFTLDIVREMEAWEKEAGKRIIWSHWSDADAFNYSSTAKTHKHKIVFAASRGRIELRAADKGPGSVLPRLNLLQQLLFEDRLFINRKCIKTIEAFRNLKRVPVKRMASKSNPIDPLDPYKHIIDSLSYPILMDLGEEANVNMVLAVRPKGGVVDLNL